MLFSVNKLSLRRTAYTSMACAVLGLAGLTGCGAQLDASSLPQTDTSTASASSSSTSDIVAPSDVPADLRESLGGGTVVDSTASASASSSVATSAASSPSSNGASAASSPAENSGPVNLADYQGQDFDSSKPVYQFSGLGLKCNLTVAGVVCWRKPVEFTGFPFEGASVGQTYKYRFDALTEASPKDVSALEALSPKELSTGQKIEFDGTTCTNDGKYMNCDSAGYHFQMNATEILPRPDNLK